MDINSTAYFSGRSSSSYLYYSFSKPGTYEVMVQGLYSGDDTELFNVSKLIIIKS